MRTFVLGLLLFLSVPPATGLARFFVWEGCHNLFLGPEVYHSKRTKEGGSHQTGWLVGGRVLYERRAPCKLYWAFEGAYAYGTITGKTGAGKKLKSHLTDGEIEGHLGYTFCFPKICRVTLTPYGGYGLFTSINDFVSPSPLHCKYFDNFQYALAGIDAYIPLGACLQAGVNFKAKFMTKGRSTVTEDDDYDDITLLMSNKTQYEVELPIRYKTCWKHCKIMMDIAPFARWRHFGGRVNFPFDFIDTKFRIYGARALVEICF